MRQCSRVRIRRAALLVSRQVIDSSRRPTSTDVDRSTPPRFVTRTLVVILASIAFALTAVFVVVTLGVRDHARRSVIEKLETGQRLLATLERRHIDDLRTQVSALAENSTARAALEMYAAERRTASEIER